jgi:hypothetical protein
MIAPAGATAGPSTVIPAKPVTDTASVADNVGGSGVTSPGRLWTVPGVPPPPGASATYRFSTGTGLPTIALTFDGSAGNQAATLTVTLEGVPPATPEPSPAATPEPSPPEMLEPSPPEVLEPSPPSGSGAKTTTTGGATISLYKAVVVTGRSARCIPIPVQAGRPRRFAATLETVKGKRRIASGRLTLEHGGTGVIHLALPENIKPGTYVIIVGVSTLKGKRVGKRVSRKVTLR